MGSEMCIRDRSPSPELTIESVLGKERIIEIQLREDETIWKPP